MKLGYEFKRLDEMSEKVEDLRLCIDRLRVTQSATSGHNSDSLTRVVSYCKVIGEEANTLLNEQRLRDGWENSSLKINIMGWPGDSRTVEKPMPEDHNINRPRQ